MILEISDLAILILGFVLIIIIFSMIKIVPQGFNYTVERLGRFDRALSPGLNIIWPFIERKDEHDGTGARCADPGNPHQGQRNL